MQQNLQFDYLFKFILVGDSSVGKSTMLAQFINEKLESQINPTMGVQFGTKRIKCNNKYIKLQVWDTAGQQSFRTITRAYYKNAIGVILMYDINSNDSNEIINNWLNQIHDNSHQNVKILLVANKIDQLTTQKQYELQKQTNKINNFKIYYISAKTGYNVNKIFKILTEIILYQINNGQIQPQKCLGIRKGQISKQSAIKLKNSQHNNNHSDQSTKCCM